MECFCAEKGAQERSCSQCAATACHHLERRAIFLVIGMEWPHTAGRHRGHPERHHHIHRRRRHRHRRHIKNIDDVTIDEFRTYMASDGMRPHKRRTALFSSGIIYLTHILVRYIRLISELITPLEKLHLSTRTHTHTHPLLWEGGFSDTAHAPSVVTDRISKTRAVTTLFSLSFCAGIPKGAAGARTQPGFPFYQQQFQSV